MNFFFRKVKCVLNNVFFVLQGEFKVLEREYIMKDLVKGLNENRVCICIMYVEDLYYIILYLVENKLYEIVYIMYRIE